MAEIPGPIGIGAIAGVSFLGNILGCTVLGKLHPVSKAKIWKVAAARTGISMIAVPVSLVIGLSVLDSLFRGAPFWSFYVILAPVRFLIWLWMVSWLCNQEKVPRDRLALYAFIGTLWSCLLDVPAVALAMHTPGWITFAK